MISTISNINPLFTQAYSMYTLFLVLLESWVYSWELVSIYVYQYSTKQSKLNSSTRINNTNLESGGLSTCYASLLYNRVQTLMYIHTVKVHTKVQAGCTIVVGSSQWMMYSSAYCSLLRRSKNINTHGLKPGSGSVKQATFTNKTIITLYHRSNNKCLSVTKKS